MSGADWMIGDLGKKKPPAKLERAPSPAELDQVVELLEDSAAGEKKLVAGLKKGIDAIEAIRMSGLTGEALVVLVTAKCSNAANGKPISDDTVKRVLEALFRLGEYSR